MNGDWSQQRLLSIRIQWPQKQRGLLNAGPIRQHALIGIKGCGVSDATAEATEQQEFKRFCCTSRQLDITREPHDTVGALTADALQDDELA